jgi:16S rRNA (guanine527-N7)-methyltransferase
LAALSAEPDPPTTIREPERAADEHVADSLSGLEVPELRSASRVADLGSGAGFPGLPLAVALPSASVDLVESTARKCEVIERLAVAAGVGTARALPLRVEELGRADYQVVTARALAPLSVLAEYAAPLLGDHGVLVAWKGELDAGEWAGATRACARVGMEPAHPLAVDPFPGARSRHLVVIRKVAPTPAEFPRRPGMARKRPLG